MQQFLHLSKIDIFWFIPFLVLSFIAAVLFFDAYFQIYRRPKDGKGPVITKLPHENFFNYYCGVIMLIAYLGTLISMFFLLSNFNIKVSDFSDLFKFMGVGIKSSLLGVAASAMMSTGVVYLEKLMERRNEIVEGFDKELMMTLNANEERTLMK